MNSNHCMQIIHSLKQHALHMLLVSVFMSTSMVYAETVYYADYSCHLYFTLDTETHQALLGTGAAEEHNACAYPPIEDPWWLSGQSSDWWTNVVVPETVTYNGEIYTVVGVSQYAFYRTTSIETVQLPSTIKSIGKCAFCWAVNLKSINIPEGVTGIGEQTFELCRKLDTITLPSTIASIETRAFFNCIGLKQINIPSNCNTISSDAFVWCDSLETLIIEDGVEPLYLGYSHDLGIDFEKGFQNLHTHALYSYSFYRGQFADCNLKNIYVGRNIIIPNYPGTTNVYSPFEDCYCTQYNESGKQFVQHEGKMLKRIEFGPTVTSIPDYLFYKCSVKEAIDLPSNVQYIGSSSFANCISAQNHVVIPVTCDSIGSSAFSTTSGYSNNIKYITCKSPIPPALGSSLPSGIITKVPAGCGSVYKEHPLWGQTIIMDSLDQLIVVDVKYPGSLYGRLAFQDVEVTDVSKLKVKGILNEDDMAVINSMTNLYELDMSETQVTDISGMASIAKNLSHIQFPSTLTNIPQSFFSKSHLTDTLVIPSSVSYIGRSAFFGSPIHHLIIVGPTDISSSAFSMDELVSAEIYGEGTQVQTEAIRGKSLQKVTIGKGVTVQKDAFYYYGGVLTELELKDGVDSIKAEAFKSNYFKKITIEGKINFIAQDVFLPSSNSLHDLWIGNVSSWCSNPFMTLSSNPMTIAKHVFLEGEETDSIRISDTISNISDYAFAGLKTLKRVYLSNRLVSLGKGCFYGCDSLVFVQIPSSLREIGEQAFKNCHSIVSLDFPSQIVAIGKSSFEECSALSNLILPDSLEQIGERAFLNCNALENITLPLKLNSIGDAAFMGCSKITSLKFPIGLQSIGEQAFSNCTGLKTLKALWVDPFEINANTFDNVSKKCILWVPYNTVGKYYATGWGHIPLIEEGFYMITVDPGVNGTIRSGDFSASASKDAMIIDMEDIPEEIILNIEPDSSYYVTSLILDSVDITSQITLQNHQISIFNVNDNITLSAEFEKYEIGDVNADDYVDVGDITSIVSHIQQNSVGTFIPEAADCNHDKDIDVGDIVGEVNLIYDLANQSANSAPQKHGQHSALETLYYRIYADDAVLTDNQEVMIPIRLENNMSLCGLQMEFELPELLSISANLNMDRLRSMNICTATLISENRYQVLCASTNNNPIQGSDGTILYITLSANTILDEVNNIPVSCRLADMHGNVYKAEFNIPVNKQIQNPTSFEMTESEATSNKAKKVFENGSLVILKDGVKYTTSGMRIL